MVQLSIVIPAYNENDRLIEAMKPTIRYLLEQDYTSEIIVVSDGSSDNTKDVAQSFEKEFKQLHVIEYHPNRGKGYAVKTGMLAAQGEVVLFMDADYAVPIECLEKGMTLLEKGNDIAIGSRGMDGASMAQKQSAPREMASRIYTFLQNRWIKVNFCDTQCGFKMYTRKAVDILFPQQKLCSVIFDGELLFLAQREGLRIAEFPVKWTHHPDSRITYNLRKSINIFIELFKIRWLHRFGK